MFRHIPLVSAAIYGISVVLVQGSIQARSAQDIAKIAKATAVKIQTSDQTSQGSGVIVQKQGDLYTVLTAAHVLTPGKTFKLSTAIDDQSHSVTTTKRTTGNIDLAIVQFRSSRNYQVAKIGNSNLLESGMDLYVSGFPVPTQTITKSVWVFREGKVTANSNQIFEKGYSLIYSNRTLPGMSGGAVLNPAGELVAIHGRGDRSADNSKTDYNLGIPINRFGEVAKGLGVQFSEVAKAPAPTTIKADDYFVSANNKNDAGNYRGALADYNQAIAINPNYAPAYYNRGNLKYQNLKDYQGALKDYDRAIAINPVYASAYVNRGSLKDEKLNDTAGALKDYNQAISIDARSARTYYNRGNLKDVKLNDTVGALLDYGRAIALEPFSEAYNNRALLKESGLNDPVGALEDYSRAIALNPKFAAAYNNRGLLRYQKLNDNSGAMADLNRAIAINPKYFEAYSNRGGLKDKLNDVSGAMTDYNLAISLSSQTPDIYYNRGILKKSKLNNRSGAIADFRRAANLYRQQGRAKDLQDAMNQLQALGATE